MGKYVFAIPGTKGYVYGKSNTVLIELLTNHLTDNQGNCINRGYEGSNRILSDIGYGILVE